MPHIPRTPPPRTAKPTTPAARDDGGLEARHRLGLARLSLRSHTVDPSTIFQHFFGTEPQIDEHTGAFVVPARPG